MGMVTDPVVTVLPTEEPDTMPHRAEEMTATLAGPPEEDVSRLEALDSAGLTENVDGIRLDELSYLKMDYVGRFTVRIAYGADYEWELKKLTLTLADEKIQSNMTGTIDLRLKSEKVFLIQNVR